MKNSMKQKFKRFTAAVLSVALAASLMPNNHFSTARAEESGVSLEYNSTYSYWEIPSSSDAWTWFKAGDFEITVVVASIDGSDASFGVELQDNDSSWSRLNTWYTSYGVSEAGTYSIDGDYAYFAKHPGSDWDTLESTGVLSLEGEVFWGRVTTYNCTLESVTITQTDSSSSDSETETTDTPLVSSESTHKSTINVTKVSGIDDDFICGMDVSSYFSEVNSGVKYYDYDGNELDDAGFFSFLKECGTTCVRIRVWNDPFDSSGNTYGGGDCDLDNAKKIGKLATDAGLKVLIDFHYSDFWADPSRQLVPKAWSSYSTDQKASAIKTYTTESLTELKNAGVDIYMVQIGNETTQKFCGSTNWTSINKMFKAASEAIRAFDSDILIALHFSNIHKSGYVEGYASSVSSIDYDVFAVSYYPYWHGSMSNMKSILSSIASTYNKKVMIAETAYWYTTENGDTESNNSKSSTASECVECNNYDVSAQGQASFLRDVCNAVSSIDNGIGVFYWEPAWIPVTYYDETDAAYNEALDAWNTYGSGWATSYASSYDSANVSSTGGTTVDNSALFDFFGYPLDSLETYKFLKDGNTATEDTVVTDVDISYVYGCQTVLNMPTSVTATLSDGTTTTLTPSWNEEEVAAAATANAYSRRTVHGTVSYGGQNHNCVAILYYWGEAEESTLSDTDEDEEIFWTGTVAYDTSNGITTLTETDSNGITLTNNTWVMGLSFDSDALSAIGKMGQPTLQITRSGGNSTIWGFGIADSSWNWLVGNQSSEITDTTLSLTLDTSVSYLLNDRDWDSHTFTVTVYDADPANATTDDDEEEETTGVGYLNITEDIAGYVGDITITVNYTGNSSWDSSWINLIYYDAATDANVTLKYAEGAASGEGTLTFSITAEELATLQSSSYVEVNASYDSDNAKYTAFIDSASVSGLKPYVLYTQKTDVVDGKYSQRWVELITEEDAVAYSKGTLVITRENDNKTMTVTLTKYYNSVSAAGEKLTAPEGYVFLAYAMLNIPADIVLSASTIELE